MVTIVKLPHEVHKVTCYVNGLFDILTWKGTNYDYFLLSVIGDMASFVYVKFKLANPPCMVFWGNNPKYFLKELGEIIGYTETISEGKSFNNEFPRIKNYLDNGEPVIVGAVDMYYLHYYAPLYHKQHAPGHYLLVVGYDDEKSVVYVHDCGWEGVQEVPYSEFESALDVDILGWSKKNTYRVFSFPRKMPTELEVAEKGLSRKAERVLRPPTSRFGIPAMRKLAKEIISWKDADCYKHMVAYAGLTPPLIPTDLSHNDGLRFEQARVLKQMGQKYHRKERGEASDLFIRSGELIVKLCEKALTYDGKGASELLGQVADIEEKAYKLLLRR